jgi:beta-glucuronidase
VALYPQRNEHREIVDLSGLWSFQLDPDETGEQGGWVGGLPAPRSIAVPGSWNEQFADTRDYLGVAWYLTRIVVPASWRGQTVMLRVGSATYAAKVWINGKLAGSHLGGHLPFEFDISPLVAWQGTTTIAIQVENKALPTRVPPAGTNPALTANTYPDVTYDFFPYSGLHRPVLLYCLPKLHIADATVVTSIAGADGVIEVAVAANEAWSGSGELRLESGSEVIAAELAFKDGAARATLRVPKARFWSPDDPFLYPLSIALTDSGRVLDSYSLDVGIRTVAVQGDRLLLNGRPIELRGFGRHEDFPVHGRGLDLPVLVRDHALLKWIGANSYRTSHYPYSDEAMHLADREGFLVIDEIPAVGLLFDDGPEAIEARLALCKQQIAELVARDKNHPSVIMWSLANEPKPNAASADGSNRRPLFFAELFEHARTLDRTRPLILVAEQRFDRAWLALSDVVTVNRYSGWYILPGQIAKGVEQLAKELDELHAATGKPVFLAEFGADAIAGNHSEPPQMWSEEYQTAILKAYLELAAARPWIVGTHVWNFADFKTGQAAHRPMSINHKGVFTRDRQPKMAAHFLRAQWTADR